MKLHPPAGTARLEFAWAVIAAGLVGSLALDNLAELKQMGDQTRQLTQQAQARSVTALTEARCATAHNAASSASATATESLPARPVPPHASPGTPESCP